MKWKLVFIVSELSSGGQARAMCSLANGFKRRGHDVTIISLERTASIGQRVEADIRYLGTKRVFGSVFHLGRLIWELEPRVIVTAATQINILGIFCAAIFAANCRVVVTEHSMPLWQLRKSSSWKLRLLKWAQQISYGHADSIVAVSEPVAQQLSEMRGLFRKRVVVIYNIVLNAELLAGAARPPHHPWLMSKTSPVVIALGHLIEPKGYDILIKAFHKVREQCLARLIIFGEGNQRPVLQALILKLDLEDCVDLPGRTANPYAEIMATDLLVSAAWVEAAPLTVCEAVCLGKPVVATDAEGGTAEMLGHGRYGRLVPVGQPEALAAAIIDVLEKRSSIVESGGGQRFDESTVMERWTKLIMDIK